MRAVTVALLLVPAASPLRAQDTTAVRAVNDSISVRFVDTDIRGVIQALGRYLPKPVLVGNIQPARVSLETPAPVPRIGLRGLLKGLVESRVHRGLEFLPDRPVPPVAARRRRGRGRVAAWGGSGERGCRPVVCCPPQARPRRRRRGDGEPVVRWWRRVLGPRRTRHTDPVRRTAAERPSPGRRCTTRPGPAGAAECEARHALWTRDDRPGRADQLTPHPRVAAGLRDPATSGRAARHPAASGPYRGHDHRGAA